jgi:hypothetical protein
VIGGQNLEGKIENPVTGGQNGKSCDWRAELKIMFAGGQD